MHGSNPTIGSFKVKEMENGLCTLEATVAIRITLARADSASGVPREAEVINTFDRDIEAAGQKVKQAFFGEAMRVLDAQNLLAYRRTDPEFARRGTRNYTFKTSFGTVACPLFRVATGGELRRPTVAACQLPPGRYVTTALRERTCGLVTKVSVRAAVHQLEVQTGEVGVLARTDVWEIACAAGKELSDRLAAEAEQILSEEPTAAAALLAAVSAEEQASASAESTREAEAEAAAELAEVTTAADALAPVIGFGATQPWTASSAGPRRNDPGTVIVEADEVVTHAQKHTGKKRITEYTAVILTAFVAIHLCAASPEQLQRLVAAQLLMLGLREKVHRLLFVCDGARWIRSWFAGLSFAGTAMVLCWYHLRKRCEQGLSMACHGRPHRTEIELVLFDHLWHGRVQEAMAFLVSRRDTSRNRKALDDLVNYLQDRAEHIPDYATRRDHGLINASTRVEKLNDWTVSERCKGRGMSWHQGVHALATLQTDQRNAGWKRLQTLALAA